VTENIRYRNNFEDTSHERLDGETIVINLATGHYFSLSGPAADVFYLCCSGATLNEWWPQLAGSYLSEPTKEEVATFVTSLLAAGLVLEVKGPSFEPIGTEHTLPDDFVRGVWTAPVLEEFEDLQDLILVDPIHDTTNLGWPYVEGASD
jgi:hypothetical protein